MHSGSFSSLFVGRESAFPSRDDANSKVEERKAEAPGAANCAPKERDDEATFRAIQTGSSFRSRER